MTCQKFAFFPLSFILNPRVSKLCDPNTINTVIIHLWLWGGGAGGVWWVHTGTRIWCASTFHLHNISHDQYLGSWRPKIKHASAWTPYMIFTIFMWIWHHEGQAEPTEWLTRHYHLCLRGMPSHRSGRRWAGKSVSWRRFLNDFWNPPFLACVVFKRRHWKVMCTWVDNVTSFLLLKGYVYFIYFIFLNQLHYRGVRAVV